MSRRYLGILTLIFVVGFILRTVSLTKYPAGFTPDEAAFGYNAYSLLLTGHDEWSAPWWQLFIHNMRSFGDYKLPLYTFFTVPSVKVFGLNEFATRLPNAILGSLAIVITYLLARQLRGEVLGLFAACLLAISPWHVSLSRGAFEANLVTLFLPLGIYLFLRRSYLFSAAIFLLNAYSYHSARLVSPLVLIALFFYAKPKVNLKTICVVMAVFLPLFFSFVGPGSARVSDVGIFHPTDNWREVAKNRFSAVALGLPDQLARVFSNKITYLLSLFAKNYLSYLSPDFLFASGAGESTYGMISGRGVMYYIELPILLVFLISVLKKPSRFKYLLVLFLLIAPLPAALAKGPGHAANRAAPMIPFLVIATASGLIYLIEVLKKYSKFIFIIIPVLYFLFLTFFLEDYFYRGPYITANSMNYGFSELLPRLSAFSSRYADVRFSRSLSEPHIFVAFFEKIDPRIYQAASAKWSDFDKKGFTFLDQMDGYFLEKYRFGDIHPIDPVNHPVLFIGKPSDFPPDFPSYFQINYPDSRPAIEVAQKIP